MPWALPSQLSRSAVQERIRTLGGTTQRELAFNLVAFCRALRTVVANITAGRIIDTCRSLTYIDLGNQEDFHAVLQANLISSQDDLPVFEALFQLFWQPPVSDMQVEWAQNSARDLGISFPLDIPVPVSLQQQVSELLSWAEERVQGSEQREEHPEAPAYSPLEQLAQKNFEDFSPDELMGTRKVLEKLAPKLATALSRRRIPHARGREIDLRRSIRHNLRYGGEMLTLARRRRKVRKLRLTLLCDVSGSMDRYSRFLLQFIYGLEHAMAGVDAWVFSTRLTEVTPYLRGASYDECLTHLAQRVTDWSGGTTIGRSLHEFAQGPSRDRVNSRSVIIIISDGWDRGEVRLLERAMRLLKRRAHAIIWLNPLLGDPNYQPLCAGMKAALPFTDYFLPAHNLASLLQLTKTLAVLGRGL